MDGWTAKHLRYSDIVIVSKLKDQSTDGRDNLNIKT